MFMEEDVKPISESTETPVEETEPVEEVVTESTQPQVKAGDKTPPNALLESLQKERAKRKELEELLTKQNSPDIEVFSSEGIALQGRIQRLEAQLTAANEEKILSSVQSQYPALKDKMTEFEEYRQLNYPTANIESVAKLFLVENDLLQPKTPPKGLEKGSTGPRTIPKQGMTSEDVKDLRNKDYKKYTEMLMAGKLDNIS
jgi:hypothetical protein